MPTGNGKKRKEHVSNPVRAKGLRFTRDRIVVSLADDREISVPLVRYPTLQKATGAMRARWKMTGSGEGFYWPSLDLDLSVSGLTHGLPELLPPPPRLKRNVSRSA